jgi:hypothetical protein
VELEVLFRRKLFRLVKDHYPQLVAIQARGEELAHSRELAEAHLKVFQSIQVEKDPFRKYYPEDFDIFLRLLSCYLPHGSDAHFVPVCSPLHSRRYFGSNLPGPFADVLHIALEGLPVPGETSSWQDILDFRSEQHEKQWCFRRWLNSLATKNLTEAELRDEIEWSLHEYSNAMKLHKLKASHGFVDVFVITPLEIIENVLKFNWSKIARGALQVRRRQTELMEAEMKAPGRECAYVFEATNRFGRA